MNDITQRATLRKQLLDNGYRPLPLIDKGIRIKGWVRDDITPEWVARFDRSAQYPNTGIRCDDLIAFDIDVLDGEMAYAIDEHISNRIGKSDLCRVGQWPKRLVLYRVKGRLPDTSSRTGKYEQGEDKHQVELLCTRGRQFAAYGIHPGTKKPYYWDDYGDPLSVPFKELPTVTVKMALKVLEEIDEMFSQRWNLTKYAPGGERGLGGESEYDLTDHTKLEYEGELTTWGDLKGSLTSDGGFGNLMREQGEMGDSGSIHFFVAGGSGAPCAHDFPRDCTHWESLYNEDLATLLTTAVLDAPTAAVDNLFVPGEYRDLLNDHILLNDKTVRRLSNPLRAYSIDGFRGNRKHLTVQHPEDPKKTIPMVSCWEMDPDTLRADYAAMRPDKPRDDIIRERKDKIFNTYFPPDHPTAGGEADTAFEFIEHLIPDATDRDLFIQWHALKVAHPHYRMHGLVMVTPAYGTGRGTWTQILQKLFGSQYVREISLSQLIGHDGQSQFNDYMAESLIVSVPEAFEEREDQSKWATRHAAYEQLKLVCEPVSTEQLIKRKYGHNSTEKVFASIQVSSNHLDALAIESGDRRLLVIDNTETPLVNAPDDLYSRIQVWKDSPANIGALYHEMLTIAAEGIDYQPFGQPPMTPAKRRMIESSQSDADKAFDYMVDEARGAVVTPSQWRQFAIKARTDLQLDLPLGERLDAVLTAVLQKRGRRIDALAGRQLKVKATPVRPWIIRDFARWKGNTDLAEIRAEILKNGDPGGGVVAFPGAGKNPGVSP